MIDGMLSGKKDKSTPDAQDPILSEFSEKESLYLKLSVAIKQLIESLADKANISIFRIEDRVKDYDSLAKKINRPDKKGKYNNLNDITDICGIRVVLFSNEDCNRLSEEIRKHFSVDEENSTDKIINLPDDRFGYLSTHIIASLLPERAKLFEYEFISSLKAEIQIRTVLQHAWAVLDWKLNYKSELEVPRQLRRKLFRISALLEAADEVFSDVQLEAKALKHKYNSDFKDGRLDTPINRESLQSFFENSEIFTQILQKCADQNIEVRIKYNESDGPWSYLIGTIEACGIKTIEDLSEKLTETDQKSIDNLAKVDRGGDFILGLYTTVRVLLLSRLSIKKARQIIVQKPSGKLISPLEHRIFSTTSHQGSD